MGVVSGIVDGALVLFSAVLAVSVPLIDGQALFPGWYSPQLVQLKRWYEEEYGDYLTSEKPHFFVGLVWVEVAFLLPLSLANAYGIVARRPWAATTSLVIGISGTTAMVAIMAELLGSGRASDKTLQIYVPFVGYAVLALLKGLFSCARCTTTASHSAASRKKRA